MFAVNFPNSVFAILYVFYFVATDAKLTPLIVISFDGFRYDYISDQTPNFKNLKENFASAKYLEPIFPTRTFTNHHTMATGLWAGEHEVIDNPMLDAHGNKMKVTYEQFHAKEEVVPIWIENEFYSSGGERHSAVSCWPGSIYKYQNRLPSHIIEFIDKEKIESMKNRVDQFIQWIINDKVNLVMAYYEQPDKSGHYFGADSDETQQAIRMVDEVLGYVFEKLSEFNLENDVNLIVLSDHGMRTVTFDDMVYLENCFVGCDKNQTDHLYKSAHSGCNVMILPNPGKYDSVYEQLKAKADETKNFFVYKKETIPPEYNLGSATRLEGMLYVVAKPGLAIWNDIFAYLVEQNTPSKFKIGCHGYNNKDELMRTIFLAKGPMFKKKFESTEPISMIEVYPLLKHLLNIRGDASELQKNKKMNVIKQLLVDDPDDPQHNLTSDKKKEDNDPQSSI